MWLQRMNFLSLLNYLIGSSQIIDLSVFFWNGSFSLLKVTIIVVGWEYIRRNSTRINTLTMYGDKMWFCLSREKEGHFVLKVPVVPECQFSEWLNLMWKIVEGLKKGSFYSVWYKIIEHEKRQWNTLKFYQSSLILDEVIYTKKRTLKFYCQKYKFKRILRLFPLLKSLRCLLRILAGSYKGYYLLSVGNPHLSKIVVLLYYFDYLINNKNSTDSSLVKKIKFLTTVLLS